MTTVLGLSAFIKIIKFTQWLHFQVHLR
uniref:Uncharacterized protein n=1 Tax=Arundo donax TaxID=35708 RepID=A0A0A8Y1P8_ARUDO